MTIAVQGSMLPCTAAAISAPILHRHLGKSLGVQAPAANWFIAAFQSWLARLQSAVTLRSASQISFVAASSEGKWPRVLLWSHQPDLMTEVLKPPCPVVRAATGFHAN